MDIKRIYYEDHVFFFIFFCRLAFVAKYHYNKIKLELCCLQLNSMYSFNYHITYNLENEGVGNIGLPIKLKFDIKVLIR